MASIESIKARLIVREIVKDLSARRGLRQEWDQIGADIKQEIIDEWETLAVGILTQAVPR